MRQKIRSLAHRLARVPFLSRAVHIVAAIYRLPELRRDVFLSQDSSLSAPMKPPVATDRVTALEGAWRTHLPALVESISAINHRVSGMDQLLRAIPMSLREAKRESVDRHNRLAALELREQTMLPRFALANDQIVALGATVASLATTEQDRSTAQTLTSVQMGALESRLNAALERADEQSGTLAYLLGRVEFVRRELMFELRYGSGAGSQEATGTISARILNTAKVEAARRTGLRLNLGSGHIPLEGYINVDLRELPTVDVLSDVEHLPFDNGEVDEIMSAHMLEHFPEEQLRRTLLPYWFGLLREGGMFRAVVPDAEAMMREYARGRYPYADFREVMFGGQDYDGDFHYNMFTPGSLDEILREAGFDDVEVVVEGRRNGQCFEFEIVARKPGGRSRTIAESTTDTTNPSAASADAV